ncbi:MAG: riboflavin kinase, partial [Cyanobacteriota bacterium]
ARTLELVGEHLIVEPVALLRDQQRFDGLEALRAQIGADAERARLLLGSEGSGATGVGMGQSPPDEGGDPADQQNS